jgi:hypothetical protein
MLFELGHIFLSTVEVYRTSSANFNEISVAAKRAVAAFDGAGTFQFAHWFAAQARHLHGTTLWQAGKMDDGLDLFITALEAKKQILELVGGGQSKARSDGAAITGAETGGEVEVGGKGGSEGSGDGGASEKSGGDGGGGAPSRSEVLISIAVTQHQLGNIWGTKATATKTGKRHFKKAITFYRAALDGKRAVPDQSSHQNLTSIGVTLSCLAQCLEATGDNNGALALYQEQLEVLRLVHSDDLANATIKACLTQVMRLRKAGAKVIV